MDEPSLLLTLFHRVHVDVHVCVCVCVCVCVRLFNFLDIVMTLCYCLKVTTKYMTKYERARVLGARALQIR